MIESLITFLCLNLEPKFQQACTQTLVATSIQTQLKQNIDKLQQKVEKKIVKTTGPVIWHIGFTIYQVSYKREIAYTTNFKPISDTLSGQLKTDSLLATFTWVW